jgi:hypothetical protein
VPDVFFLRGAPDLFGGQVAATQNHLAWAWTDNTHNNGTLEILRADGGRDVKTTASSTSFVATTSRDVLWAGVQSSFPLHLVPNEGLGTMSNGWLVAEASNGVRMIDTDAGTRVMLVTPPRATVRFFDLSAFADGIPSATLWSPCPLASVSVTDTAASQSDFYVAVDGCYTSGKTAVLRYSADGGYLNSVELDGTSGVIDVANGILYDSFRLGTQGARVEMRDAINLTPDVIVFTQAALTPKDLVVSGSHLLLVASTDSTDTPPQVSGSPLFPALAQNTFLYELNRTTLAPERFGVLGSQSGVPAQGGSTSAFGRVWISGYCSNADGGFCQGARNAYLFGVVP